VSGNISGNSANVTGTVALANGGTGQTTAAAAITALTGSQTSAYYLRSNGTNATLSALSAADVTGTLAIANGGTGTATPALVAGTNVTISGTWPNQTINSSGSGGVSSFSAGTTGFTPSTATTGVVTLAGTLATTNGGTGLTSFTANGVVYASSTSALTTGSALTFDGTNLGVGTATAGNAGAVNVSIGAPGTTAGGLQLWTTTTQSSYLQWGTAASGTSYYRGYLQYNYNAGSDYLAFGIAGTEAMRLTGGNLLVGKTSSAGSVVGSQLLANGQIFSTCSGSTSAATTMEVYSTGASAYRFYVDMGGTIHATSVVITAISDQRLKENVRDIDTGLSAIMALKPRRFDWKEGKGQDKKNAAGFIAQEFEDVFPECVGLSKAGGDGIEYKNINHETLIPTLVKAIQEQQALIESLTTRLTALDAK
jgi:hypothetical protein